MWCGCREALNVFFIDSRAAGPDQDRTGQAAAASLPSCLPRLRPGRGAECWPGADLHTVTISLRPARAKRRRGVQTVGAATGCHTILKSPLLTPSLGHYI